jgi:beta-glucuronidase
MIRTLMLGMLAFIAASLIPPKATFARTTSAAPPPASQTLVTPVLATPPLAITEARGREGHDLSGQWAYIVDPMRMGFRQGRMRNFSRDLTPANQELLEYEWATAPKMAIPGDWNSQVEELRWYDGVVWFHRRFSVASIPDGQRSFLHFEAVNQHAHVYLNGQNIGEHKGGFTPFSVEVTGRLQAGENFVVIGADSLHTSATVPPQVVDWWNYGGITRPVRLVHVPTTFIRNHGVSLAPSGDIIISVTLDGAKASGTPVSVEVPELQMTLRGVADDTGKVTVRGRPKRLVRWEPANPKLYDIKMRAGGDSVNDRVGLRTIEVDGARILLNGRPVFLRGISIHEEALGPLAGRVSTRAQARALLEEAKALGANFVRLAHYPHIEDMTKLADEMGLLVWSEIPVYWQVAFANPDTLSDARLMLAEMIERDRNRASIIIWSVGNETPETEARLSFMRTLIQDVRDRDPSRLVSAAMHDDADSSSGPDGRVKVDDPIGAYIDFLAMNRYEAWYGYRNPRQIDEVNWDVAFDKPLIFSEFGADALFGYRADPLERWSEDYQALLYERTLAMAERIPNLAGTSPWILKDFRSPRRFHGRYQEYWNRKGLIDPTGNRKRAYFIVRDWYACKAEEDAR